MFYTLYHIFKQERIQGRGTIKGRGMIKGRHLALYQIFKTTVFTTKYMIKRCYVYHIIQYLLPISWSISLDMAYSKCCFLCDFVFVCFFSFSYLNQVIDTVPSYKEPLDDGCN